MKKSAVLSLLGLVVLVVVILLIIFNKSDDGTGEGLGEDGLNGTGVVNQDPSYSIDVMGRGGFPGEDIYVYDDSGNLVLSLEDKNQPQYLFVLYENYLVLDSGTEESQREMLVYDIPLGKLIYKTDYFPGEYGLVLNDDNITFYREIPNSLLGDYVLPDCENEYDNAYIENFGYKIGEDQVNDLGDIQCVYIEY